MVARGVQVRYQQLKEGEPSLHDGAGPYMFTHVHSL
jgi:hypothetical protein